MRKRAKQRRAFRYPLAFEIRISAARTLVKMTEDASNTFFTTRGAQVRRSCRKTRIAQFERARSIGGVQEIKRGLPLSFCFAHSTQPLSRDKARRQIGAIAQVQNDIGNNFQLTKMSNPTQ